MTELDRARWNALLALFAAHYRKGLHPVPEKLIVTAMCQFLYANYQKVKS